MANTCTIKINTALIESRMKDLKITNHEMSRRLGRSNNYTKGMLKRGTATRVVLPLIANILDLPTSRIILEDMGKPQEQESGSPQTVTVNINTDEITELLEKIAKNEVNTASTIRTLHETIREQDLGWRKEWAAMKAIIIELKAEVQLLRQQLPSRKTDPAR